jgi:hypothetical protein
MKQRLLGVPLCVVVSTVALSAPRPKDRAVAPIYFPTRVGAKWVYQNGQWEGARVVTTVDHQPEQTVVTTADVTAKGELVPYEMVAVSAKGLYWIENLKFGVKPDSPACLLSLPHRPGEGWTESFRGYSLTACESEEVDVPAGRFRAIRVEENIDCGQGRWRKNAYWYAEGVGLVKEQNDEVLRPTVLKSFDPGKK